MANTKISALSAKAIPVAADTLYIVDSDDTSSKKCTFTQLFTGGTAWTVGKTGVTWTFAGDVTIAEGLAVTASGATITAGGVTVTAGGITTADGQVAITDDSNAAAALIIQNDTITTFGNGATEDQGMVIFSSDTLTTGDLVRLQLDESALAGGAFLKAVQTDAAAAVFTIAENGATTIAGAAAGTDALSITAGDITLTSGHVVLTSGNLTLTSGNATLTSGNLTLSSGNLTMTVGDASLVDGSLTIVDADNAATLSVTNDTATTASVFVYAGSGTFTGSTTTSFMTITPSGLTTGTAVYLPLAALTQGKGLHITSGATQTTGTLLYVQDTGADAAITSGTVASFDLTATAITSAVNKTGAGVAFTSSRTTTTGTVSDDFDLVSIVRTDIINGAGSMAAAGSVLYIENAVTNTSGTVTDTVNGVEVVMDSLGTGDGIKITHGAAAGRGIYISSAASTAAGVLSIAGNSLTSGQLMKIATSATAITGNGRIFLSDHTGATGTSAVLNEFASAANDETTVLRITASDVLAGGVLVDLSAAAVTTGTVLDLGGLDALTTGTGIQLESDSADSGTRSLLNIVNDNVAATGTTPLSIQQDADVAAIVISGLTTVGIDFTALGVADSLFDCTATTDVVGKNPESDAETGFIKIDVAGSPMYIPYYAAA